MISPIWIANHPVPQEGANMALNIRISQISAPSVQPHQSSCLLNLPSHERLRTPENILSQQNEANSYKLHFATYCIIGGKERHWER